MAEPGAAGSEDARPPAGYRVLRTLGHGADGWVTLAVQESVQRNVAVKTLYAAEPDAVARFRREGQALSRVVSDRVVRVYDLIEDAGRLSLVMEYVAGGSLAERLLRPPALDLAQRLQVLADVAEALAVAHRAGVVHRDVKPANVLLDGKGRAKLSDFGIARLTSSAAAFRTMDGSIAATRRYAPPEQIADPGAESPAIDAYAFAILAYELLVGPVDDEGLPASFPDLLPLGVHASFRAATHHDPSTRPAPDVLVRDLAAAPMECWTVPADPATSPSAEGTARGPAREQRAPTLQPQPPTISRREDPGWVQPSVYRPGGRRRDGGVPVIVGALIGLLAAGALALLWW